MIWRLAICFSAGLLALPAGNVTGRVQAASGDGAVVWLQPASQVSRFAPSGTATAMILQRNKTFTPHLLAVESGTTVQFPNQDPFFHNAFSNYSGQVFDTGLYAPGTSKPIVFRRPGVVRVFCNIHPTMSAVIVAVDTPYFTVTAKDGSFSIPGVPAGDYTLHVFTERASKQFLDALPKKVVVEEGPTDAGTIVADDKGFTPVPKHKNKYGKEYPAVIVDQYPGTRP